MQRAQLTEQVEVIAELQLGVPEQELTLFIEDLRAMDQVEEVTFWTTEQVAQFIDERVFRGYESFIQEYQLDVPVQPLLRIQLADIRFQESVVNELESRLGEQLIAVDAPQAEDGGVFVEGFLGTLDRSRLSLQALMMASFGLLLAFSGYVTAFFLSERSRGFHLSQVLHWSVPYTFWPALFVSVAHSLGALLIALILSGVIVGVFWWSLGLLLFGSMFMLDVIFVWFGRFVVVKWGMR